MKLIRTITLPGAADPDWVGDESAVELSDDWCLDLHLGWTDFEWYLDYVDGSGSRIGADSGTFNAQVVFKTQYKNAARYNKGATQTSVSAGIRQNGDSKAGGGTRRPATKVTIRLTGGVDSPPTGAVSAQIFAQEV